jgi:hypothetical protein
MPRQNYILFCIAIILIPLFANRGGMLGLAVGLFIIFIYFFLFKNDAVLAFVLCAVINSNPVMLMWGFSFGFPKQLQFQTVFFLLSFLVVFSPQVKERRVDYNLKIILPILFLFVLYQFLVSFLLKVAPDNPREILRYIYRQIEAYLSIYMVIPSYIMYKLNGKKFINAIALATILFTVVIMINLYTPADIFIVRQEYRNGAIRIFLFQSTLFYITTYVAIAAFTFYGGKKAHILYYLAGFLTMAIPFIAMYRMELFTQFLTILLVVFIVSRYLNRNLYGFVKLLKVVVVAVAIVLVLAPHVYEAMVDLYTKTFQELLGTGPVEKGTTQTRTEYELPLHLSLIRENPILGVGWRREWWDNLHNQGIDWGLTDIPLTATLAMYGWLGMLIYYSRYLYFLPLSKRILTAIRNEKATIEKNEFHNIVLIALRAYFIAMITFRFFYISYELTFEKVYADFGTLLGMYFASIYIIENHAKKNV